MIIYNKYQINEATRGELQEKVETAQAQYSQLEKEVKYEQDLCKWHLDGKNDL